jgi:hypothetical protein
MWGIIGHVTVEAGNTVGTDGAPPQCYICTFVHEVREYLYYCNDLFLTAGMLVCTRFSMLVWYAHVGCLRVWEIIVCTIFFRRGDCEGIQNPYPYLLDKNWFLRFKSEITQQFFVKYCGKTLLSFFVAFADISACCRSLLCCLLPLLIMASLLAVVPFCVACCSCIPVSCCSL